MKQEDYSSLAPFILAALIERMGGIVELDAKSILKDIKEDKYNRVGLYIYDGKLRLEIFDENKSETA